ncbi:MAG: T9SS type A sorting domain-containing protein [Ignavibacteriae bacterium]|nr:T9SS type A sorting domain-containing protein [Ignavibacteriota bacterium]
MKKLIALIIVLITFSIVQFGNAQTIYVNSVTGNDATGNGTSGSPYKTFHKGYTIASSGNTINLTGTFTWTDAGETGDNTSGYTINKNLTICGQGASQTIVQAHTTENSADRRVFSIGSGYTVTIRDLTIRHGRYTSSNKGAGIYTGYTSNLSLINCIIEKNYLSFVDNDGRSYGGAGLCIYYLTTGSVNIDKCLFQYNSNTGGTWNSGGAIMNQDWSTNTGAVTITNSTFNNNTAAWGSAIFHCGGRTKISNSTFINNVNPAGSVLGSTIYFWYASSSTQRTYGYLTNVTVAYNTLGSSGYGVYEDNLANGSVGTLGTDKGLMIKNCIIAQNKRTDNTQKDYYGSTNHTVNNGYNLVETKDGTATISNGVSGCIVGVQANLRLSNTLAYNNTSNGTQTLALYGGSVAVNAGNSSANGTESIPTTDQRGKSRSGSYDMGAFEYNACLWKGTTSTDYGTASNWNETVVPADGSDIAIDATASNNCLFDINRTVGCIYNAHSTYQFVLNSKTITVQGDVSLSGSAQFDASSGEIIFSGGSYSGTITPSSSTLSIINLSINNSNGIALGGNLTVTNTLTLTNGLLTLGAYNLTLGSSATISGTPSATNMIVATSTGELRKTFTGAGSFAFPVGDNTGTSEYSPITLNFTSGTFSSAYAGVTLGNSKYSNNTSVTDYLNRYWTVNQSGISDFSCDVTAQYLTADVVGTESNIYAGKYNSSWIILNQADAVNHRLTGTVSGFSTFTGGQQGVMPVEISAFNSTVSGRDVKLNWVTSSETNNAGFEIQKSIFGNQNSEWNKIGYINGNGTKNIPTNYNFTDTKLNSGKYNYRLKQIDNNGNYAYHILNNSVEIGVPTKFALMQNYPNPFNPKTKIDFQIPNDTKVTMKIYDVTGREIATLLNSEYKKADYYTLDFNATNIASGIYFYRITADKFVETKKMLMIK